MVIKEKGFGKTGEKVEEEEKMTRSTNNSDIEVPPPKDASRMLTASTWIWEVILSVWLMIGVGMALAIFKYPLMLLTLLGYMILFVSWLIYCYQTVGEKERAKPVFLGQIGKLVGSGPVLVRRHG